MCACYVSNNIYVWFLHEELGKGDTVRTIIKFLSNEHTQERELAVSLLYEDDGRGESRQDSQNLEKYDTSIIHQANG